MRLKLPQPNYTPFAPKDKLRLRISFLFYVALTFFLFICTVCTYHSCRINSIRRECCKGMQDSHLPMKTLGLIRSPGPILLQRVSPIVRTFHSGFNGSSNHVSLASRDNLCTLSHRPQSFSVQREGEREKWICQDCSWGWWIIFEICRQFTWVRCIWLLLFPLFCVFVARHDS